jgi:HPt (histidine-containing phosphotransfer) domain-containing protein
MHWRIRRLSFSQKLVAGFVGFILLFAVANLFAASRVVDGRVHHELETSELLYARGLAARLFPLIRDKDSVHLTEAVLDEMSLREEKLAYLLIFDRDAKLLAHTYLAPLPPEVRTLRHDFAGKEVEGRTSRVSGASVDAFDVAVPVLEGIAQVGSVHIGIRAAYLGKVRSDLLRLLAIVAAITFVLAAGLALGLGRLALRPVHRLVAGIRSLERGERTRVAVTGTDELASLAVAFNEMVERIGEREDALRLAYSQVRLILDNTGDGLLSLRVDGSCDRTVSKAMVSWLGEYGGQPAWEYLFAGDPDAQGMMQLVLQECAEGFMPKDALLSMLPSKIRRDGREYRVSYRQIGEGETLSQLLVVVNDVTEEIARALAEDEAREEHAILRAFADDREGTARAFRECGNLLEALRTEKSEIVQKRLIHTLKGNTAILGLTSVARECHAIEDALATEAGSFGYAELERLALIWARVERAVSRSCPERNDDRIELDGREYAGLLEKVAASGAHALLPAFQVLSHTPTLSIFRAMGRATERLASQLGKLVEVNIEAHGVRVDTRVTQAFWGNLVHVLRNSVDHGIESPAERAAAGKSPEGRIRLASHIVDGNLTVELGDDGRGIAWEQVRERARSQGLPSETREDLVTALMTDGVSTRDEVSDLSGRGVGLASVLAAVKALGGRLTVLSDRGKGTTFRFEIPIRDGVGHTGRRAGWVVTLPPNSA